MKTVRRVKARVGSNPTSSFAMAIEALVITDVVHSSVSLQCLNTMIFYYYRGVEQLAARRAHNPEVAGSSPAPAIAIAVVTLVTYRYSMRNESVAAMSVNASASTDMVHSSESSQCLI